jgi:hypothetical protein
MIIARAKPIAIIAEPGRELEAALRLGRIGFDHVRGYLRGGMQALAEKTCGMRPNTPRGTSPAASTLDWVANTQPGPERRGFGVQG